MIYFFLFNDSSSIVGDEKCGTTYESCVTDPPLETSSERDTIGGILFLIFWFGLFIFSCWCRYYRRNQAEKNFIRRVQTAVAEVQQPRTVYVVVDRSAPSAPLINEQPPPSNKRITTWEF